MKKLQIIILCLAISCLAVLILTSCKRAPDNKTDSGKAVKHEHENLDKPDNALAELIAGNQRYIEGKSIAFESLANGRRFSAEKQTPHAIVVCCSDSRVPPEEIFDVGIGEIFVVRSAGEVLDSIGIGSIEYAVEHLKTKLIIVLGHERCGAVTAAVKGGEVPGHIKAIVNQIDPVLGSIKNKEGDKIENAIKANITLITKKISSSEPIIKELVESGEVKIVGAYYDLDDGNVEFSE